MLILLLALFFQDKPKFIDIKDLIDGEHDRYVLESNAKGNAAKIREVKPAMIAQRQALLGTPIRGEGKIKTITVQGIKTSNKGVRSGGGVNVMIEVPDGKQAKIVSTKALDPTDPILATLKKGDEIRFAGTLSTFTPNAIVLSGAQYKLKP